MLPQSYLYDPRMAACGVIIWLLLAVLTFISALPRDGSLRLVGGETENCGRVEVCYDGEWGTVCDNSWHTQDANVVCRQLGFESVQRLSYRAGFGEGTGPIWIDRIRCSGNEASILECAHNGWGIHNCRHREDAGVCCNRIEPVKPASLPLRLNCPTYNEDGSCKVCPAKQHPDPDDCYPQVSVEGIVEVYYNDRWRPVSADGWDIKDAKVACGELGYPIALGVPELDVLWPNWNRPYASCDIGSTAEQCDPIIDTENKAFRERLKSTFLKKVDCIGNEHRLLDCYFPEFGPHDNPSLGVATVQCGYLPHQSCYSDIVEVYRTRSGPVPWMGRAEVRVGGVWGTICDTSWDFNSASVFCRALGYGTAMTPTYRGTHGRGVGEIHYSDIKCTGSELYLSGCTHKTGPTAQACGHRGDAGAICNAPQKCELPDAARLIEVPDLYNPSFINHFVEVKGSQGWGLLCYGNLELKAAEVVCRENKNQFAIRVRSGALNDYSGHYYIGLMECNGEEMTANECTMKMGSVTSCTTGHTMIDCTTAMPDLVPDLEAFRRSFRYYPYVDRISMYYLRCAFEEGCLSSSAVGQPNNHQRRILRFDSLTMNWGTIDFLPNLQPHEWQYHSCHRHYHSFEAFIHYDILNITTGEKKAEGHKASFCLADSLCASGSYPRYRCGGITATQGISVNCGDLYGRYLDCQWVDITDIAEGTYILRLQVNPDRLTPESDYRNNEIQCTIQYQGHYLNVLSCEHSDH